MKNLIIVGAGRHANEVFSYLQDLNNQRPQWRIEGFVDEKKVKIGIEKGKLFIGFEALKKFLKNNSKHKKFYYITAVGDNLARKKFVDNIEHLDCKNIIPTVIKHPSSITGDNVVIGAGTLLAPGAIVTTNVTIGCHCILNVNISISHDCCIGDFVNVNPGAVICGDVKIGSGCFIGAGATIIDKISIGSWTVIGAGAVVTRDLPSGVTAVGVPARIIKKHNFLTR